MGTAMSLAVSSSGRTARSQHLRPSVSRAQATRPLPPVLEGANTNRGGEGGGKRWWVDGGGGTSG